MASDSDSEASFLEQLISSRNRDLSLLLPLILGFSNSRRRETPGDHDPDQETGGRQNQNQNQNQDRIILINPFTQGMIVIESSISLDALLREISDNNTSKEGLPPASKTSIDAMPKLVITDENRDDLGECAICLEGWEIGGEAREMPCKHNYHSNCIEKWLGIHGSCPVCRFEMPIDDHENCKKGTATNTGTGVAEEERDTSFDREVWVSFSFNRRNSTTSNESDSTATTTTTSNQSSSEEDSVVVGVNGSSASTNEEEEN